MGEAGSHHGIENKTAPAAITTGAEAARITDHVICLLQICASCYSRYHRHVRSSSALVFQAFRTTVGRLLLC
jgi:hypothetical protein